MSQPDWEFVDNLGDASPIEHGGLFIYKDKTGVYVPEMEKLEPPPDDIDIQDPKARWRVWRVCLEPCTFQDGVLSDNKFHPNHAAWFAKPESEKATRPQDTTYLSNVASCIGETLDDLRAQFVTGNIQARARAYESIAEYHGWDNFDHYPMSLTLAEVKARYTDGEIK